MITRRQAIKTTALAGITLATLPRAIAQGIPAQDLAKADKTLISTAPAPTGPFTLPPLPYAYDALEPHIDTETMHIHHDKHHAAYVANLNKAVADYPELGKKPVEDLLKDLNAVPEKIRTAVRNNGGGHYNHSLFWLMMKPNGGGEPTGELAKAIDANFGSFSAFKEQFTKAAMTQFGSGWAWLIFDLNKKQLAIDSTPNQDSTILGNQIWIRGTNGNPALLGLDVWEHAYYLKHQNKRADYIAAWWNVVNWDFVSERYAKQK